jgi:O-antigen ligase
MPIESLTTGGSVFYFRYIFFALGVWYLLDTNRHLSKCLLNISIICIVFVCIDAFFQYFFELNFFGNKKHSDTRLTGLFGDEPIVGRYIAYLSTFTFVLIYQNFFTQKKIMKLSIIFLVLCEVTVFLSGERAPLFSFILFTFLIIIFVSNFRIYKIITVFFSIVIILCVTLFNSNAKTRIVDLSLSQLSQTQLPFLPYSDHHEEHYISVLKMFKDKPIFGIGTNLFRFQCNKPKYKYKERSCNTHPHNFYFQILAELGIIGFGFLCIFFLYIASFCIRKVPFIGRPNKTKELPFDYFLYTIILFINWWPIIPHMNFYNNWNNILIMLPLGFFMRYFFGNKNGIID